MRVIRNERQKIWYSENSGREKQVFQSGYHFFLIRDNIIVESFECNIVILVLVNGSLRVICAIFAILKPVGKERIEAEERRL